ncbi:hypothetical protein ACMBCN_02020 [Candidatus Liberibacter asiaticus]
MITSIEFSHKKMKKKKKKKKRELCYNITATKFPAKQFYTTS